MAAAALVLLAACGRDVPPVPGTEALPTQDRGEPLALAGPTLDGGRLDLADLRGRIVVLNNWASWCGPCRNETPELVALSKGANPDDVVVVGMNVTDEREAATAFVEEFGMPYPSIEDPEGALLQTVPGVPPSSLPSTVILDRDGRIAARVIGETDALELSALIARILEESTPASASAATG